MSDTNNSGGLLDGIDAGADTAPVEDRRLEIDPTAAPRKTLDDGWSSKKRAVVGTGVSVLAVAVLGAGGWFWWSSRPPALPTSGSEALAVISSARFDNLDEDRKRSYFAEAARLVREMPEDERAALRDDETLRDAVRELRRYQFDEMARRMARGEDVQMPWGRPGGNRPGGGERRGPPDPNDIPDEVRDRIADRITQSLQSGSAQENALRGEFFQQMRGGGGGGGGRRGP
jgi:hypothetical protein